MGLSDDVQADVVIVGGGVAGCAAAMSLLGNGLRIVIVEQADRLGGRAQSDTDARTQDRVDIGPHVITSHHYNFLRLLESVGTLDEVVWQGRRLARLFTPPRAFDVRLYRWSPPLHLAAAGLRAPVLTIADKLSNVRAGLLAMSLESEKLVELDSLSADVLLRRLGVSPRARSWLWQSVSMTLLNGPIEVVSAGALMRVVRQALGHRDIDIGVPRVALDQLFVRAVGPRVQVQGGAVLLGNAARHLDVVDQKFSGVRLANGLRIVAPIGIVAVEPQAFPRLLPSGVVAPVLLRALAELPKSEYISVMLWLDQKVTHERIWGRMHTSRGLNYDFYDLSNIRSGWSTRPSIIASNMIYSQRLKDWDDEAIVARTSRELNEVIPRAADAQIAHYRVHRIPMAIPVAIPGSEFTRLPCTTAVEGLYLASDWCQTQLPACMESAARAGLLVSQAIATSRGWRHIPPSNVPEPTGIAGWLRRRTPNIGLQRVRTAIDLI